MESLPKDLQALLSRFLPKIFIAIDGLTSLRDVSIILEHMALRLIYLEYAMSVWRQAQSPNGQEQSHYLRRISHSNRSRHSGSSARWRLLFSDKYLYFLFKDILLDCSKQLSDSDNAHTHAESVPLRHASGPGLYELLAAPARAVLRNILEASLRILIEELVLSNTAKYGTWQDIRLRDTPPTTRPGFSGTVSQDTSRTSTALQKIPDSHRAYCSRVNISEAMQNFQSLNTTQASDSLKMRRFVRFVARYWRGLQIPNGSSAHLRLGTIDAASDLLLRRGLLLDHSVYTSSQMSFSMQKPWSDNISFLSHWKSVSGCRVSKSTTFSMKDLDAAVSILPLVSLKVQASRTTRHGIARLLVRLWAEGSAIAISLHETEEGHCVLLQPINFHQIKTSTSCLRLADTGTVMSLSELANPIGSEYGGGTHDSMFRTLLESVAEAVLGSEPAIEELSTSHQGDRFTPINKSQKLISVNSRQPFQRKVAAHHLSISGIPFKASHIHRPASFHRTALLHSFAPAHHRSHQDAPTLKNVTEFYLGYLPRQIASGQASFEDFESRRNSVLHFASFSGSAETVQFLLNAGADPVLQSERWLHLVHNHGFQQSVSAKPPSLDRPVFLIKNLISYRKDGVEGTNAKIWKDRRAAVIGVRGNKMAEAELRSGPVTKRSWMPQERSRARKLQLIAGSSKTRDDAADSLSTLTFMLRTLSNTANIFGFWKQRSSFRSLFGMPSRRNFNRLLRPRVPQDHVRLTWICHCGKELYGDFHNGDPSAVARLANLLQKRTQDIGRCSTTALLPATGRTNQTVMQSSSSSPSTSLASGMSGTSSAPSRSSASSFQTSQASTNQIQPPQPCHLKVSGSTSKQTPGLVGIGYNPVPGTNHTTMQKQYVEMCVNTGQHYQRLAEIDVARHKTDADLFRWIRKRYGELRGWRTKWQYFLRPQAMSYVEFALDRKQKVHIYRPKDAYPPKAEIDAGRYMYNMPPPPIPSNTFIHYLRECDLDSYSSSQDNEILEIIAKKMDTRVSDHPSLSTKAYGMLVHEGPDVTAILWTMMIIIVTMCGPLVAFIVITKDVQSATGLAAAALAVVTLLWMGIQVDRGMNFSG